MNTKAYLRNSRNSHTLMFRIPWVIAVLGLTLLGLSTTELNAAEQSAAVRDKGAEEMSKSPRCERIDGTLIYDYDPSTKLGDDVYGTIICDHENNAPGRCSHGGPVCLEYPNGDLVAFHTNTSDHNLDGWSEYAVSKDGGKTWDMNNKFKYSYETYQQNPAETAWVIEGLVTQEKTILLFVTHFLDNDSKRETGVLRSVDCGATWSDYELVGTGTAGATAVDGKTNYVLFGNGRGAQHALYVSTDDGRTWTKRSTPSLDKKKWYGGMCLMHDGRLLVGAYDTSDETHLHYCISDDQGHTWTPQKRAYLDKKIRDPELAYLAGRYYVHGRSGHQGEGSHRFVLYQSEDGENWSDGVVVSGDPKGPDGYSHNCIINKYNDKIANELMVEYSIIYDGRDTNEYVFFVKPEPRAGQ